MAKWPLIFAILAVLLIGFAFGQISLESKSTESKNNQTNDINEGFGKIESDISNGESTGISPIEIYLSLGVLAFGLVLIIFAGLVALKKSSGWDQEATRIFAVSVIVTAGLFLMTAGYSDEQVAPMFGLLGTIVGYLLGKSPQRE